MTREPPPGPLPRPFRIGLRPLRDEPWLRIDGTRSARLAHKRACLEADREAVYRRVPGHRSVEEEVLDRIERWLADHGPSGSDHGASLPAGVADDPSPLCRAASRTVEDLAVLCREEAGWVLVSACIASPSVWRLADKIGRVLGDVHGAVPGYGRGTRADALVERMFDASRPGEPVVRGNWSLHATDRLYLPELPPDHADRLASTPFERLWLRHERQTLSRLARSRAILFTIDVTLRSVGQLAEAERGELVAQVAALDPAERAYRGLTGWSAPAV